MVTQVVSTEFSVCNTSSHTENEGKRVFATGSTIVLLSYHFELMRGTIQNLKNEAHFVVINIYIYIYRVRTAVIEKKKTRYFWQ